jgi:uncharacterized protein YjiS (DUF1127 family)
MSVATATAALRGLLGAVRVWCDRARRRARLAGLSERDLRDIGISRCDAYRETCKPFWRG